MSDVSDRVLVATRKGLFTLERGRGAWTIARTSFLGDNVSLVFPDHRSGAWLAALNLGHFGVKLHRSTDDGATWTECQAPALPEGDEPITEPQGGRKLPSTVTLIWSLAAGGATEPGVLWCGTIPGALFRSADGGLTWKLVESLWRHEGRTQWFGGGADYPGIHSICVDPRDHRRVLIGVSCGGVWSTTDGGATWGCLGEGMRAAYMPPDRQFEPGVQDPHCLAQCAAQPDRFWVQHHNGIFRSTDGARRWTEITGVEPSTFGFAVAVHPADGDTAWFVPGTSDEHRIPPSGQVVVTRTRDGGRTFESLRRGLPQAHAYDLTYRHALDVDAAGKRLAFGTTTGSVWISEDQGDNWLAVSEHLPPVYAVRFA